VNITSAFPSRYLKAADIPLGQSVTVTVRSVVSEGVESDHGPAEDKPVLYFMDKKKGLVLNRTNAAIVSEAYGDETDAWTGLPVEIYTTQTEFRGRMVPCLRLRIPAAAADTPTAVTDASAHTAAVLPAPPAADLAGADDVLF